MIVLEEVELKNTYFLCHADGLNDNTEHFCVKGKKYEVLKRQKIKIYESDDYVLDVYVIHNEYKGLHYFTIEEDSEYHFSQWFTLVESK